MWLFGCLDITRGAMAGWGAGAMDCGWPRPEASGSRSLKRFRESGHAYRE